MTAMVEALSFLGPCGPVARDAKSCNNYDSKHAAGVCLGTIQARTNVQLALACQRSMFCTQHRLRVTTQHVYGHTGNLGNEYADHAAALGSLGFVSSHCRQIHLTRHFLTHFTRVDDVHTHCMAQDVPLNVSACVRYSISMPAMESG